MKYYILLLTIVSAVVKSTVRDACDICLRRKCFVSDLIYEGHLSSDLVVDRTTNELYFQVRAGTSNYTKVLHNLDTNTSRRLNIPDEVYVPFGAFNQETRELYLASPRGLGIYTNDTYDNLAMNGSGIYQIQYSANRFFFSRISTGFCHLDGIDVLCSEALKNIHLEDFVIDKNYDIFYRSGCGIYKYQRPNSKLLFSNRFAVLGIDKHGELYYSDANVIFKYNYDNKRFDDVGTVTNATIFKYTFDRDNNLIYCDISFTSDRIYKLSLNKKAICNNAAIYRTDIKERARQLFEEHIFGLPDVYVSSRG